jgi:hypothetical protein
MSGAELKPDLGLVGVFQARVLDLAGDLVYFTSGVSHHVKR